MDAGIASGRHDLASLLDGLADAGAAASLRIGGLSMDSRRSAAGDLFLACAGSRGHGAAHVAQAVARGAVAVALEPTGDHAAPQVLTDRDGRSVPLIPVPRLRARAGEIADRFYGRPSEGLDVVGITGTNGKTSVSHYLAAALAEDGTVGLIGTLGAGLHGALEETGHTTPDPITLHGRLAAMRAAGARAVAMEVSSHALDQGRVAGVRFACGVFTNLSRDHLDYHGSLASYAAAKRRLLDLPGLRAAVINADDATGRSWLDQRHPRLDVIDYALECDAALRGEALALTPAGLSMELVFHGQRAALASGLLGRFNAYNLLAAAGALLALGASLDTVAARLGRVATVPGRMERFGGGGRPLVVVDYAHTPDALEHVLGALREHRPARLICVFGCGGERDAGKRPLMGAVVERLADRVIVTDDNPRGEDPDAIVAAILAGMKAPEAAVVERDRAHAIAAALAQAQAGDVVLVAGKGHEAFQEADGERRPFSDRATVAELLGEAV